MKVKNGTWRNWGRNQSCTPHQIVRPVSEEQLCSIVSQAREHGLRVKPIGAGHSFTGIGLTDDVFVDMSALTGVVGLNRSTKEVTVRAGTVLKDLNAHLWQEGFSMPNLGDIDAQTVSGAIATGTHGTGANRTSIAAGVVGLRLVLADGSVMECDHHTNADVLRVARVGLGALGIISEITFRCDTAFKLEAVEETLTLDEVLDTFTELSSTNDHAEFFWFPHTQNAWRKLNNRTTDPISQPSKLKRFLADELTGNYAFEALNRLGKAKPEMIPQLAGKAMEPGSHSRHVGSSHSIFCSSRKVRFVEMEYSIARPALLEAFGRVRRLLEGYEAKGRFISFPIEVRVLGADDIPLSPAFGRQSGYIAVHVYEGTEFEDYFSAVEQIMDDYDGRPHWGKMHYQTAETLAQRYPQWDTFVAMRDRLDPARVFANPYLDRVLGP